MKHRNTSTESCTRRAAFSLFELMIVLAVLVTIASIAAPNLMDRVRSGRVQEAGEEVRELVANARRYAIETGVDYHFRYEVNGQAAVALPADPEADPANSFSADVSDKRLPVESLILDKEIFLRSPSGENPGGEQLDAVMFGQLEDAGLLSSKTWSSPIVFKADGSAEDRTIRVMDEDNRSAEVSVRGLTGAVRAAPVFTMEAE